MIGLYAYNLCGWLAPQTSAPQTFLKAMRALAGTCPRLPEDARCLSRPGRSDPPAQSRLALSDDMLKDIGTADRRPISRSSHFGGIGTWHKRATRKSPDGRAGLSVAEFVDVLERSSLAERRPPPT